MGIPEKVFVESKINNLGWRIVKRPSDIFDLAALRRGEKTLAEVKRFERVENYYLFSPSGIYYPMCGDEVRKSYSELDFEFSSERQIAAGIVDNVNELSFIERVSCYRKYMVL
jgi:hypothetical protein